MEAKGRWGCVQTRAQDVVRGWYQGIGTGISEVEQRREENTRHPPRARGSGSVLRVESNLELFDAIRSWPRARTIGPNVRSEDGNVNTPCVASVERKILGQLTC